MAKISMELIKELREKTQVGMMDCKKALAESDGDIEKAIEILRKKGTAVAAKRASNETNNGCVTSVIADDYSKGALALISCETDFSANTEHMKNFADNIAKKSIAADTSNIEKILDETLEDSLSVKETLNGLIAKIGEKIAIGNVATFSTTNGIVNSYIHAGGNLGVIILFDVEGKTSENTPAIAALAKDVCMQIAVTNPLSIDSSSLDQEVVAKEKAITEEQLKASGKPDAIIEKIMVGKMNKYYEEVCLLNQKYIKQDKITIQQHIDAVAKETNTKIIAKEFKRFAIGK
jgi:elongation factor Ts